MTSAKQIKNLLYCPDCHWTGARSACVDHYASIHAYKDEVPYYCSLCSFASGSRSTLLNHTVSQNHLRNLSKCDPTLSYMREHPKRYNVLLKKFLTREEKAELPKVEPRLLQLIPSPDKDPESEGFSMDNVTIIIESADETKEEEKPDREFIPKEPKKEAPRKRSLEEEEPAPTKRAKMDTIPITTPMPEVEEPIISLDFNSDFLLSSQSCSSSSGSSTASAPTYKPTPIERTTDEVLMGRVEGLEAKLQTNNEAMLCLQATSIEILQQLKDIRGMVEAKDNKFKSIPLSENRNQVLDTYSDCQQRYDRHGVPFHDRKDPRARYTSRHHNYNH